jgi:hypothetical protein
MIDSLRLKNRELARSLGQIKDVVERSNAPAELRPYRERLLVIIDELVLEVKRSLDLLDLGLPELIDDVLSQTAVVIRYVRLLSFRFLRPLFRASPGDRVCLTTIQWLHENHAKTRTFPAVFADDDCAISPTIHVAPMYFFSCLEQRGLLFQPLLFHEFGHLLYLCHHNEMDDLVADLQRDIEQILLPVSQRNDRHADVQAAALQKVVDAWYLWTQEFFCDAAGLTLGGPCFLKSFSEYMLRLQPGDFYSPAEELGKSSHPPSWLRMQVLVRRARLMGYEVPAADVESSWRTVGAALKTRADYHGFYEPEFDNALDRTIGDMLTEVAARPCSSDESHGEGWQAGPASLVALLNEAWRFYQTSPEGFPNWETDVLHRLYGL